MKTERLIQSGILNNGEPRHYASWEQPQVPKLNLGFSGGMGDVLNRRQRARSNAPVRGQSGWTRLYAAFRRGLLHG